LYVDGYNSEDGASTLIAGLRDNTTIVEFFIDVKDITMKGFFWEMMGLYTSQQEPSKTLGPSPMSCDLACCSIACSMPGHN
jgi:hypothetical protein